MELRNLEIAKCYESPTNPRGAGFEGTEFDELVESIKEKGVLMPVLARPHNGKFANERYEIIAGNRRFRAAKQAGLKEIPARVVEMTDTEAREAQIVENLQRADIHPIDEAFAYRDLIENSTPKLDVAGIASKVGKSVSYIRQRLVLSELEAKIVDKVREGVLPVGHAVLIAQLDKAEQSKAYKFATQYQRLCSLSELRKYITEQIFRSAMKNPPWKDDAQAKAEIAKVTGLKGGEKNLFGEEAAEKIENPADYALALAAYLQLKIDEYAKAGKPLTLVSGSYSTNTKGLKGRNEYSAGPGHYGGKCKSFHDALIVEGDGVGKLIQICTNKACTSHNYRAKEETPQAKAKAKTERKTEIEAGKRKAEKDTAGMTAAVAKISWPLSEKHADVLLALALKHAGSETYRQVVKRRELSPDRKKNTWGGTHIDYEGAIRKAVKDMKPQEKAGLLFELLVPSYSVNYNEGRASTFKQL